MKQRVPEITEKLTGLDMDVWDRGYYHQTDEGCWYEVYVNDAIRKIWSPENMVDIFAGKSGYTAFGEKPSMIHVSDYDNDNQLTFFVPVREVKYTLKHLTDYFLHSNPDDDNYDYSQDGMESTFSW